MKVLLLHNRYQLAGGEDAVVQAEKSLLEANNHQVVLLEISNDAIAGVWGKANAAVSAIYSQASKQQVKQEIANFCPDVAHIHNFFPLLSPSVYDACRETKVPVVQTLHNYRLGCPNALLFREGKICEDCLGKKIPLPGILHSCYRGSRSQSAVTAAMLAVHWWRGTWQERVDAYIALTAFQKQKMILAGLPEEKIHIKPNYIVDPGAIDKGDRIGEYALFVGRLSREKGVATLIEAYIQGNLHLPLKIVGEGPVREILEAQVQKAGLENAIEFLGWQEKSTVQELTRRAKFLVFPSVWYETFGLTAVEAFACGLPVIASRLGSMAEIVRDGVTGLHFTAGNAAELADKLQWLNDRPEEIVRMGKNARLAYEAYYTPEVNYQYLIEIYQKLIGSASFVDRTQP